MRENKSKLTNNGYLSDPGPPVNPPGDTVQPSTYPQRTEEQIRQRAAALSALALFDSEWRSNAVAVAEVARDLAAAGGFAQAAHLRALLSQMMYRLDMKLAMAACRWRDFLLDFGGEEPADLDQYREVSHG